MTKNVFEQALSPSNHNRPVPFWSWNDKLESDECRHQIDLMHGQGIGGFFMHARGGLHTEYLSDEWFGIVKDCIRKAGEHGMNAWAYDENGWPSGFGGGLVNGKGVFYQQKYLRYKNTRDAAEANSIANRIAVFTADGKPVPEGRELDEKGEYLVFYYQVNPYYVDTLDGRVIAEFLSSTHQQYYSRLTPEERRGMRGFFTDEPQISRDGIPWSLILAEEYGRRFGEDLLDRLPDIFFEWGKNYRRTRYRFWRTVTELFSENFMKQIQEWCHAHQWELTGHLVLEETLFSQTTSNGACMPHYEYFDIPGMDILSREHTWVTLPLQLFSVAAQTGRKQILSETFALCGWAVSFADLQWLVQWQFVHGVNLVCQHLEGYSLRGLRKRDYPASLFRHQPWWPYYKPFNDYLSRIGTILEQGEARYNVLLLHPITTGHLCFNNGTNGAMTPYERTFKEATDALESHHVNHHYGDEIMMERHGSVKAGALAIGQQSYRLVILPKLNNLSSKQVELLKKFHDEGGLILGLRNDLEPIPLAVDGEAAPGCPLMDDIRWFDTIGDLVAAIPEEFRPVKVLLENGEDAGDINCTSRAFDDFDGRPALFHYFVNNARFRQHDCVIAVPGKGVEGYDTHTGEKYALPYTTDGKTCLVPAHFPEGGDFALLARDYETPAAPRKEKAEPLQLAQEWRLADATENLLTLDHARCVVDGEELFAHEYVLTINDTLLAREKENQALALEFTFNIGEDYDFTRELTLLVEHPERQRILVNGREISSKSQGFFQDPAFERIPIADAVVKGVNVIRLESNYHQFKETFECLRASKIFESERNKLSLDSEVEAVYLAGPFGVETPGKFTQLTDDSCRYAGDFILGRMPEKVKGDHLEECGLPFFAGTATISQKVVLTEEEASRPRRILFGNFYGNVLVPVVNNTELSPIVRPEYSLDLPAGLLRAGENEISLKLVTSLRNMLGPHHLEEGDTHAVCPWHFFKTIGGPFTSNSAPAWNDGYCLVRHGVK